MTLKTLTATGEKLRTEWRELPKRIDTALFQGDKDALLTAQIRERQIPYEILLNLKRRAEAVAEQIRADMEAVERQREAIRAKLVPAIEALENAWRKLEPLQREYLSLGVGNETELAYWRVEKAPYGEQIAYAIDNRTSRLRRELETVQQAIANLDPLLKGVAEGDSKSIALAQQALREGEGLLPAIRAYLSVERRYLTRETQQ